MNATPGLVKITHRKYEGGREVKHENNWPVLFETVMLWNGDVWNQSYRGTDPGTGEDVAVNRRLIVKVEQA